MGLTHQVIRHHLAWAPKKQRGSVRGNGLNTYKDVAKRSNGLFKKIRHGNLLQLVAARKAGTVAELGDSLCLRHRVGAQVTAESKKVKNMY